MGNPKSFPFCTNATKATAFSMKPTADNVVSTVSKKLESGDLRKTIHCENRFINQKDVLSSISVEFACTIALTCCF